MGEVWTESTAIRGDAITKIVREARVRVGEGRMTLPLALQIKRCQQFPHFLSPTKNRRPGVDGERLEGAGCQRVELGEDLDQNGGGGSATSVGDLYRDAQALREKARADDRLGSF